MLRFLSFIMGKPYEPCKGCEILKQQLLISNDNNRRLEETLIGLLQPKVEQRPIERVVPPVKERMQLFTHRREALEREDAQRAKIVKTSPFVALPDDQPKKAAGNPGDIEQLEKELGVEDAS